MEATEQRPHEHPCTQTRPMRRSCKKHCPPGPIYVDFGISSYSEPRCGIVTFTVKLVIINLNRNPFATYLVGEAELPELLRKHKMAVLNIKPWHSFVLVR